MTSPLDAALKLRLSRAVPMSPLPQARFHGMLHGGISPSMEKRLQNYEDHLKINLNACFVFCSFVSNDNNPDLTQCFVWCRQLGKKFVLHAGNMKFNTQGEE